MRRRQRPAGGTRPRRDPSSPPPQEVPAHRAKGHLQPLSPCSERIKVPLPMGMLGRPPSVKHHGDPLAWSISRTPPEPLVPSQTWSTLGMELPLDPGSFHPHAPRQAWHAGDPLTSTQHSLGQCRTQTTPPSMGLGVFLCAGHHEYTPIHIPPHAAPGHKAPASPHFPHTIRSPFGQKKHLPSASPQICAAPCDVRLTHPTTCAFGIPKSQ